MRCVETDLVEFIRTWREPVRLQTAASELNHLGNFGADWPKASFEHWCRELETLVNKGLLVIDNEGQISVPVVMDDRPIQQSLF